MNLVRPNLENVNGAKVVVNSLYDCSEPGFLEQDLLLVELPGKTYIDVSWFPEHDPAGAYTISAFRGHKQIADFEATSAYDAIRIVERWAVELTQGITNFGSPSVQANAPRAVGRRVRGKVRRGTVRVSRGADVA